MKWTLDGYVYNRLTGKRLLRLIMKHPFKRGPQGNYLNINNFKYNFCDCLDTLWIEMKTLMQYSRPFLLNKKGYATCIIYDLCYYFACGKGLFQNTDKDGKINPYLVPLTARMVSGNVSGWLTKAIQQYVQMRFQNRKGNIFVQHHSILKSYQRWVC